MPEEVLLERADGVAHLVLNRPDRLNAIDPATLRLLREHIATIEADPGVRAVVVRGNGRVFSAGADMHALGDIVGDPAAFAAFMQDWHDTFDAVAACSRPTVAAVHGIAFAGGFELFQVCDVAVVADDARLGDQHARYGLFPGGGSAQRLPRLIGDRRARWLLLSGEEIPAADAVAAGLANEAVPADRVVARASEMAALLATRSPLASAAIKRALAAGAGLDVGAALAAERPIALAHMASADARAGLDAFYRRVAPRFPSNQGEA
ncbi:hypothetical protein AMK25_20610 [Micromonospora sp. TSRI0369]|uniref:enoyl-CoA hydratase/isomerase family protein n=1 Tax=Micromonospora sp. TSRI0369 TaxID=1703936 RepID=UPI00093B09E4|nr:enoyl-CoA hydratase/isomerase family protein [Micromonospora sp. TSRI0369]OKJ43414.1 hypothetical protein AMK25_20610 [Micromonospora sp. TSRI0369]